MEENSGLNKNTLQSKTQFLFERNLEEEKQLEISVSKKKQSQISTIGLIIPSSIESTVPSSTSQSGLTSPIIYPWIKPMFHTKSPYEKYFDYLHHSAQQAAVFKCKAPCIPVQNKDGYCDKDLTIVVGTYSNLDRHLRSKIHKININDVKVNIDPALPNKIPGVELGRMHPVQLRFDRDILRLYADGLPLSFVDRKSFHNFVNNLDERITIKSRTAYVNKLHKEIENKIKGEIKLILQQAPTKSLHFSLDIWTTKRQISVLGIKLHLITKKWSQSVRTIALVEFNGAHTGDNIKEKFDQAIKSYGVHDAQIGVIVSDNASNMKKAFNMIGIVDKLQDTYEDIEEFNSENISNESEVLDSFVDTESDLSDDEDAGNPETPETMSPQNFSVGLGWSSCLAHTVQLAINDGIKNQEEVVAIIKEVNKIINFFRRSPKWMAVYREKVTDACTCQKKTTHELLQPNITRWNSTFSAIERLAHDEVFPSVQSVLNQASVGNKNTYHSKSGKKYQPKPMWGQQHEELIELTTLLSPLKILTDVLQSDRLTSNIVIVSIVTAYRGILKTEAKYFEPLKLDLLQNIKNRLQGQLTKKWFMCAAVLDPRLKLKLFLGLKWQDSATMLKLPSEVEVKQALQQELENDRVLDHNEEAVIEVSAPKKQKRSEGPFAVLNELEEQPAALAPRAGIKKYLRELQEYLAEPIAEQETDPLEFWKTKTSDYPRLASLARRILSIPASSGSVERLFSAAGALARARRSKIEIQKVEELIMFRESSIHI